MRDSRTASSRGGSHKATNPSNGIGWWILPLSLAYVFLSILIQQTYKKEPNIKPATPEISKEKITPNKKKSINRKLKRLIQNTSKKTIKDQLAKPRTRKKHKLLFKINSEEELSWSSFVELNKRAIKIIEELGLKASELKDEGIINIDLKGLLKDLENDIDMSDRSYFTIRELAYVWKNLNEEAPITFKQFIRINIRLRREILKIRRVLNECAELVRKRELFKLQRNKTRLIRRTATAGQNIVSHCRRYTKLISK